MPSKDWASMNLAERAEQDAKCDCYGHRKMRMELPSQLGVLLSKDDTPTQWLIFEGKPVYYADTADEAQAAARSLTSEHESTFTYLQVSKNSLATAQVARFAGVMISPLAETIE